MGNAGHDGAFRQRVFLKTTDLIAMRAQARQIEADGGRVPLHWAVGALDAVRCREPTNYNRAAAVWVAKLISESDLELTDLYELGVLDLLDPLTFDRARLMEIAEKAMRDRDRRRLST